MEATLESLHEIEDLVKRFPENEKIPAIEIDLVLQKLRNIYELMLMMQGREESDKLKELSVTDAVVELKIETAVVTEKKETTVSIIEVEEKKSAESGLSHAESQDTKKKGKLRNETLADQFKGRTTLHESLHQTISANDKTYFHTKAVGDLMAAIGLNDRFTFVRELFSNDSKAFESTIVLLNNATSYDDAYNMIREFNWDIESDPVQQLLEIIRRKFIKGQHE